LSLPVCNMLTAWPCDWPRLYIDRTTHKSSICFAVCGNSSETQLPHSPCRANFHGDRNSRGLASMFIAGANGSSLPSSAFNRGL
jgi:hypothetical protein